MQAIGVVAKTSNPLCQAAVEKLIGWVGEKGLSPLLDEETALGLGRSEARLTKDQLSREADLIVVLGGDGTFLSVARMAQSTGAPVPVMGVNLGSLGFLTEFTLDELIEALEKIVAEDYKYEDRIMLDVQIVREGRQVGAYTALNDLVINRRALARMVDVRLSVDGIFVNEYTADGLIVATPTGSTAYNLSANGPIIQPSLNALIITPICPHTLSNRPVVIPDGVTLELQLAPEHDGEAVATLDGQVGYQLSSRDKIIAKKSDNVTRVILSPEKNYYQLLREKLKWGESIRQGRTQER